MSAQAITPQPAQPLLQVEAGTQVLCYGHLVGECVAVRATVSGGFYEVRYPWMREHRVYRVEPADCVPLRAVPFEWGF